MEYENTMRPFAAGDIFIGCTLLNDPNDDHAGTGRIRQYDEDFRYKGELWTEGGQHLVGGLSFDRNGVLWAFNDLRVIHVDPKSGRQLPLADSFLPRVYRSASFASDGSIYLGEHMLAENPPPGIEKLTTIKFPRVPGDGVLGYGKLYKYDADWQLVKEYDVENCPEMTGFKGVTHSTLHPGEQFVTYTAETGKRIMCYDVINDRQMPDLVTYPGDDLRDGVWAIAVAYLPDGRLAVTRGESFDLIDEAGAVLGEYPLEGYGWSEICPCRDGEHVIASNIWNGLVAKVNLATGAVVGQLDTGFKAPERTLAGHAEFPG